MVMPKADEKWHHVKNTSVRIVITGRATHRNSGADMTIFRESGKRKLQVLPTLDLVVYWRKEIQNSRSKS